MAVGSISAMLLVLLATMQSVSAVRKLQIVSPLQALTIWDPELKEEVVETGGPTRRSRFLERFRTGLQAEADTRKKLAESEKVAQQQQVVGDKNWAAKAAAMEMQQVHANEKMVEQAYDQAVAQFDAKTQRKMKKKNANKFQFVGVINSSSSGASEEKPITWYARKKPSDAKWSLRLVHVNREAILKDLYNRGKIDVFGRYENTGKRDEKTGQPIIQSKYTVRERSWK